MRKVYNLPFVLEHVDDYTSIITVFKNLEVINDSLKFDMSILEEHVIQGH